MTRKLAGPEAEGPQSVSGVSLQRTEVFNVPDLRVPGDDVGANFATGRGFPHNFAARPRRLTQLVREPQLLRLRPSSLRTQDISHLLTGVFRNLYSAEVIGEDLSANLIKARGSDNERHEEFVDQLQQVTRRW
ncbi:Deleted in lung and esophageal cancer protein 1 [Saguinus oedipus]|uniref:Deleted in lung and esophageal cancer protein 1 n=1 Tax=Saguinus oedipus TaxID=9490 RepID=A0ABQ9U028_SAGOE|nr:Deleted in lung and esophageal cancer protein 1 [Saguinus oedipus]